MFPADMSHDLIVDDPSTTLRLTADLFEKSAAATVDKDKRDALLEYAKLYREMTEKLNGKMAEKLYREMAELREQSGVEEMGRERT